MASLRPVLLILAAGLLLAPATGSACSMCLATQGDDVRYAFLWTTGFLSLLPVGLLGLAVWWLRRRVREQQEREAAHDEARARSARA